MEEWMKHYLFDVYPFFVAGMWLFSMYLVAVTGGWRLLARRFRMENAYPGQKWTMQSARMSWLARYNRCLTIGADNAGLFITPSLLFRAWHPALFIPWNEITARDKTEFLVFNMVELRLGRSEEVPFRISTKLAATLKAAAGSSWPEGHSNAMESPPPPIA